MTNTGIFQDSQPPRPLPMLNEEVAQTLEHLRELCVDGKKGFLEAAEGMTNPFIKSAMMDYSRQRAGMATELTNLLINMGSQPGEGGTTLGMLHRNWINFRSAVSGGDVRMIIEECERGEDAAQKAYAEALEKGLPERIHGLVQRHFELVVSVHDHVRLLRDAFQSRRNINPKQMPR